ncbi:MAG: glutamate synthase [Intestinimonas sp.]|jgi:glutamate synthase domain-containing protein 3|nr:glutamate synthase [Intestinimonas sp.]
MEHIDASAVANKDFNPMVWKAIEDGAKEILISNVHSMHYVLAGTDQPVKVTIEDSTGMYTCSYLENAEVRVKGNVGWYAGDNMVSGKLIVEQNTGCNVGTYIAGGDLVVYGSTGTRVGYGMKGGHIIIGGSAERWAGQMAMGGELIVLGSLGLGAGESMYEGKIFTRDPGAAGKLGGNVAYSEITEEEAAELDALFAEYGFDAEGKQFHVIRPVLDAAGKHKYTLFRPILEPEKAAKKRGE